MLPTVAFYLAESVASLNRFDNSFRYYVNRLSSKPTLSRPASPFYKSSAVENLAKPLFVHSIESPAITGRNRSRATSFFEKRVEAIPRRIRPFAIFPCSASSVLSDQSNNLTCLYYPAWLAAQFA